MPAPPLVIQTTYAELMERCAANAFSDAFPEEGAFTSKVVNERRYWYFQTSTSDGRRQRYVGPESPELLERIAHHKQARSDERERRSLVSTLIRSFGLPAPNAQIGELIATLASAGIFRLRSVLVGTVAYQTYAAMLGVRLPGALLQTNDVDIAQFTSVSIAVDDHTAPMLEILQKVDKTFTHIPTVAGHRWVTSYHSRTGLRVDFVTPNEGPDTDDPQNLPALRTDAQRLRFLDFLIYEPTPAVVLHGPGIYVQVPTPERYAIHKLIISLRRPAGITKKEKDLQQAGKLLEALVDKRPSELRLAWEEAHGRGPKWRKLLLGGMNQLEARPRDLTLKLLNQVRKILPEINLTFNNPPVRYNFDRDTVVFAGEALGSPVECAVSRETLEDHFGADNLDKDGRLEAFRKNRTRIEELLRAKYLSWPVEEPSAILLRTSEVPELLKVVSRDNEVAS
jgi:hypothetical protein